MPERFEAGTHNYLGLAALAAGITHLQIRGIRTIAQKSEQQTAYLINELKKDDRITLYHDHPEDLPIISFNIPWGYQTTTLDSSSPEPITSSPGLACTAPRSYTSHSIRDRALSARAFLASPPTKNAPSPHTPYRRSQNMRIQQSIQHKHCADGTFMKEHLLDTPLTEGFYRYLENFGTVTALRTLGSGYYTFSKSDWFSIKGFLGDTTVEIRFTPETMDMTGGFLYTLFSAYREDTTDASVFKKCAALLDRRVREHLYGKTGTPPNP